MNTIDEFLTLIRTDEELKNLIINNYAIEREYKPRIRGGRLKGKSTKSGLVAIYFWNSFDGIQFRYLLEKKHRVNIDNTRLIGSIKTALHIFIAEAIGE